jgi:hypothetical protein
MSNPDQQPPEEKRDGNGLSESGGAAEGAAVPDSCIICTEDLWKTYDMGSEQQVQALRGLNIRIQRGEYVAIMGPFGFRQVHADEPDWLPGHAQQRQLLAERATGQRIG